MEISHPDDKTNTRAYFRYKINYTELTRRSFVECICVDLIWAASFYFVFRLKSKLHFCQLKLFDIYKHFQDKEIFTDFAQP